jgi:hypothetical protein
MSLRIAWACHPRNIGLGIAANVFVYVGTIILFMIDWFFVQRIVRAQHQRIGWSTPYRIFHRGALAILIITLLMIIMVSIWQFFTASSYKLHVFRALQLTGQTYFTVFCFAPAAIVLASVLVPRTEIEKFGAGRLRVNITILLIAVAVLTTGQLFRCVIAWIPQTPVFNAQGRPVATPWYLHKACFYVFNFVTEIVVVIMFALVRVDLRFHVPNGSRMSGDYSGRNSRVNLNSTSNVNSYVSLATSTKKDILPCPAPTVPMSQRNESCETLHKYDASVFEDSNTLADSLKYTGSTLEVDSKTGAWKVKRSSAGSISSRGSTYSSADSPTRSSFNDRSVTFAEDVPPVPEIPAEWPLPNGQTRKSAATLNVEKGIAKKTFELTNHGMNDADIGDAVTDALASLEHNSEKNNEKAALKIDSERGSKDIITATPMPPPYTEVSPIEPTTKKPKKLTKNPLAPRHRATFPPKSALKTSNTHSATSSTNQTPTITEAPEIPMPPPQAVRPQRTPSVELIKLSQRPDSEARKYIDMSLQGDKASDVSRPVSVKDVSRPMSVKGGLSHTPSSTYSTDDTTSSDRREMVVAEEEYKRFSFEKSGEDGHGQG